jgi:hypothetical protein
LIGNIDRLKVQICREHGWEQSFAHGKTLQKRGGETRILILGTWSFDSQTKVAKTKAFSSFGFIQLKYQEKGFLKFRIHPIEISS